MSKKIIGLAGSFASGKDTLAKYLVDTYGFYHISTGDIVREEAMAKYGSIERPVLYKMANEIRNTRGYGALGEMSLERYDKVQAQYPQGLIVSGFRAIAEAQAVKAAGGVIIYTDAPLQNRYEWMRARARDQEAVISLEEFKEREAKENGGVDPNFDISAIRGIADYVIENNATREEFLARGVGVLGLNIDS